MIAARARPVFNFQSPYWSWLGRENGRNKQMYVSQTTHKAMLSPEIVSKGHLVIGLWTHKCICTTNVKYRGTPLMAQCSYCTFCGTVQYCTVLYSTYILTIKTRALTSAYLLYRASLYCCCTTIPTATWLHTDPQIRHTVCRKIICKFSGGRVL